MDAEFVQSVSVRVGRNICGVPYAPSINTTERNELDDQLTVMFGEMPEGLEGACYLILLHSQHPIWHSLDGPVGALGVTGICLNIVSQD